LNKVYNVENNSEIRGPKHRKKTHDDNMAIHTGQAQGRQHSTKLKNNRLIIKKNYIHIYTVNKKIKKRKKKEKTERKKESVKQQLNLHSDQLSI
jgi:hypothetical protein